MDISQNFVAFSEYMNFNRFVANILLLWKQQINYYSTLNHFYTSNTAAISKWVDRWHSTTALWRSNLSPKLKIFYKIQYTYGEDLRSFTSKTKKSVQQSSLQTFRNPFLKEEAIWHLICMINNQISFRTIIPALIDTLSYLFYSPCTMSSMYLWCRNGILFSFNFMWYNQQFQSRRVIDSI